MPIAPFHSFLCVAAFTASVTGQSPIGPSLPEVPASKETFCTTDPNAITNASSSTVKMAVLLDRLAREANPAENGFLNADRVEGYSKMLGFVTNAEQLFEVRLQIAVELLNAGETAKAIEKFAEFEKTYASKPEFIGTKLWADARRFHALAYLRLGEQQNCLEGHTSDSCILPIQGSGIHKIQAGSRKAIQILEDELRAHPHDRASGWLLNIAYMTLGEYPDKVPLGWQIPPQAFRSEFDIKKFPDVAPNLGLDVNDHAGGTIAEDFDGDGDLDLMMSDWSLTGPMHYFRNNGDGTFTDRTAEAGLGIVTGGLNIIPGDFNNDGLADVLVLRGAWMGKEGHHPDSLLRNDGNGHFTDVTEQAHLLGFHPNQTAVWFDYNGDGWLDIYFGYESYGDDVHPCELYRNNHDGTFTECAKEAGIGVTAFVKGVTAGDYDNDGRSDLYLSIRGAPNILFRNDGPVSSNSALNGGWKFTDVTEQAGVKEPIRSFPCWFFDYDNDGWLDLFVSGYGIKDVGDIAADYLGFKNNGETARLYHNNGDGTFTDVSKAAHLNKVLLTMGCNFGDFDNDGWLDMYLGTGDPNLATVIPNRAFRNAEGKFFQDVTSSSGLGHLQKGHGVSFADLDNDGDQDIYHSVGGAYEGDMYRNALFENPGHNNRWITLKLEGVQSNRPALGARIKVVVENDQGERSIYRTVSTGGSFGNNPFRQEIGLGKAKKVKRVEIFWPVTGKTQVLDGFDLDQFYRIREGDDKPVLWDLKSFKFSTTPPTPIHQHTQKSQPIG